jgi:hypothetical protein
VEFILYARRDWASTPADSGNLYCVITNPSCARILKAKMEYSCDDSDQRISCITYTCARLFRVNLSGVRNALCKAATVSGHFPQPRQACSASSCAISARWQGKFSAKWRYETSNSSAGLAPGRNGQPDNHQNGKPVCSVLERAFLKHWQN